MMHDLIFMGITVVLLIIIFTLSVMENNIINSGEVDACNKAKTYNWAITILSFLGALGLAIYAGYYVYKLRNVIFDVTRKLAKKVTSSKLAKSLLA